MSLSGPPINAAMLEWARKRVGLSLEEAANKTKIQQSRKGFSPTERLKKWEKGEDLPSFNQLKKIAHAYRVPLITFFLPAPPVETTALQDFRTVGNHPVEKPSPEFMALRLRIESLFDTLQDIEDADPQPPVPFVGSCTTKSPVTETVEKIREVLPWKFPPSKDIRTPRDAFNHLREGIQSQGVYVMLRGDLGSYHSEISPEEFRGIAIADKITPIIVINPNDADTAQVFSLLHEVSHIFLGTSGISNLEEGPLTPEPHEIESYCNSVAAEYLVPERNLRQVIRKYIPIPDNRENLLNLFDDCADKFKVSRMVIARRFRELNLIKQQNYWEIFEDLEYKKTKHIKRQLSKGGPNRNIVDKYKLGERLITRIVRAADEGMISYTEAGKILGVNPARFDKVLT
jgi:Zn-dependent peptidase ImmA (M78 family)